jgi:transposase-like protein
MPEHPARRLAPAVAGGGARLARDRRDSSRDAREEIRRLRKENYELRPGDEIFKSASVFFAKELDPDRKK